MKPLSALSVALLLLAGCSGSVSEKESRERELPLFRQALSAEQQGDLDKAVKLYEETLLANPEAASAHLSLAILQQEHAQDYIGAIYHYQRYRDLQPGSEKEEMIKGRKKLCEQLLTRQLIRTHGDTANLIQARQAQEIDALKKKISELDVEKTTLAKEKGDLQIKLKSSESEVARLQRLTEKLVTPDPTPATKPVPKRLDIPNLDNEKPAPKSTPIPALSTPAPKPADTPTTPRTHTVQPGETLYRIAERYYGDPAKWTQIRDANQNLLGPGGQLRAGQLLIIP